MPSSRTFEEEEDAVPLTELLRTGEASRLRRRGALRSGHRRDESDDLTVPPSRRMRVEQAGPACGQRRDGQVCLELTCGVRTAHISGESSSSSLTSPLPQTRYPTPSSVELGFQYSSTGCGTVVNSIAFPSQQARNSAHQVYISPDTSNCEVASLPSRYLEPEQRSIAKFIARDDGACKCDWEAIGCRVCGNPLGFLFAPCLPCHSLDLCQVGVQPTHVFFPSSVTPSPSYTFPTVDPERYNGMPRLDSESEDMSIDSPTFSPRIQMVTEDDALFRFNPHEYNVVDFALANNSNSPPTDSRLSSALPSTSVESLPGHARARPGSERTVVIPRRDSQENSHTPRMEGYPFGIRGQSSGSRMSARHSFAAPSRPRAGRDISDDEWNAFIDRDRAPSYVRRGLEGQSDQVGQYPWVPRELRERTSGVLVPGERAADRLAAIAHTESPQPTVRHFSIGATSPTRAPEPPTLHRVPRRSLSTMISPNRRSSPFDPSSWRPRTLMPHGTPRPTYSERAENNRDGERNLRMSRWSTVPGNNTNARHRPNTSASTPTFTLVDSEGERSYPPSAQSSIDDRDTLGVESDTDAARMPSTQFYEYLLPMEPWLGNVGHPWDSDVRTEEPEADDEEKVEDEQQTDEHSTRERRSQIPGRRRGLVLDERSVNSVTQLPLG